MTRQPETGNFDPQAPCLRTKCRLRVTCRHSRGIVIIAALARRRPDADCVQESHPFGVGTGLNLQRREI